VPHVIVTADGAIGPPEILSPGRTQDNACGFRFGEAFVGRSVRCHLAAREIAQADPMTKRRMLGNRPAKADLDVIRVRAEHQQVGLHFSSGLG
jgi:hypothetical protein